MTWRWNGIRNAAAALGRRTESSGRDGTRLSMVCSRKHPCSPLLEDERDRERLRQDVLDWFDLDGEFQGPLP